jgi:hypothetical protein
VSKALSDKYQDRSIVTRARVPRQVVETCGIFVDSEPMDVFGRRLLPEDTDLAQQFYSWRAGNPAEQLRQKQEARNA